MPKRIPTALSYINIVEQHKKELEQKKFELEKMIEDSKKNIEAEGRGLKKKLDEVEAIRKDLERRIMECKLKTVRDMYSRHDSWQDEEDYDIDFDYQLQIRVLNHPEIERHRRRSDMDDLLRLYGFDQCKLWLENNKFVY